MQEGDVGHDSLVIRPGDADVLRVYNADDVQFLLGHLEGPLQVLQGLGGVTVVVVEQVWAVTVYDGTECSAVAPAAVEVVDMHFFIAGVMRVGER